MIRQIGKRRMLAVAMALTLAGTVACSAQNGTPQASTVATLPAKSNSWTAASHGNEATPDYGVVYPQDKVNQVQITIAPADWAAMLDNMTTLYGARGSGGGMGGPGGGMPPAFGSDRPAGPGGSDRGAFPGGPGGSDQAAFPGGPGGMGGPGGKNADSEKPMWVPATITFNGKTWNKVGVRFKGNSSLQGAWRSGTDKIPLKLDFEQYEDDYPDIKNQRFYGFKEMSLSTNWSDAAYMREAIGYDLLAESGLTAGETAFYDVSIDHGQGATDLGIYTAIEVIDDTVVKRTFGEDKGNLYEAEGQGATFAEGTSGQIPSSFEKKNNEDTDWGDLQALYDVLHDPSRTTDPAGWRQKLEARFDVPVFLKWLAIAAAIQHWDAYGGMSHNYYLYDNPATGKLSWISWDHNLILGAGGGGGMGGQPPAGAPQGGNAPVNGAFPAPGAGGFGGGMGRSTSLDRKDVTASWPLIRFLLDDPTYYATYVNDFRELANGPFQSAKLRTKIDHYASVLTPYAATAQSNGQSFTDAVQSLTSTVDARIKAVSDFLATQ